MIADDDQQPKEERFLDSFASAFTIGIGTCKIRQGCF